VIARSSPTVEGRVRLSAVALALLVHLRLPKQGIGGFDRAREAKVRQCLRVTAAVPFASAR